MAESLFEIGARHGTDKAAGQRQLLHIYESLLAPIRDDEVTVFEIGVLDGASLRMWRDFFPKGRIFGLDFKPEAVEHADDRIGIFIGDQTDIGVLDQILAETGKLDIVVDDGGHWARQQTASLIYLWPHLKPGGFYVVEDTHTSYLERYKMAWRQPGTTVEFLKGVVDDVHAFWHDKPVMIRPCHSISFYQETCVLRKKRFSPEGEITAEPRAH